MVCLMKNRDVVCFFNNTHFKIGYIYPISTFVRLPLTLQSSHSFPMHAFPSEVIPYRPPQSIKRPTITKITCCENTFAALSELGDVFTFTVDANSSEPQSSGKDKDNKWTTIKPQRVWALRKQMSAVVVSLHSCNF
jgi:inhibitor of Bruton tyrosine kinase